MTVKGDEYRQEWHDSKVWKSTQYRGIRTLKFPMDMWNYQEIIFKNNIDWIIELGTRHGGAAVFFADLLEKKGAGGVISVDNRKDVSPIFTAHKRTFFIEADSSKPETANDIWAQMPLDRGRLMLMLDSDHSVEHVRKELELYVPRLKTDDYLIVEDTMVDGTAIALAAYLEAHPEQLTPDVMRERKVGTTVAPGGYFTKR